MSTIPLEPSNSLSARHAREALLDWSSALDGGKRVTTGMEMSPSEIGEERDKKTGTRQHRFFRYQDTMMTTLQHTNYNEATEHVDVTITYLFSDEIESFQEKYQ